MRVRRAVPMIVIMRVGVTVLMVMMVVIPVRVHGDVAVFVDMHVNGVRVAAAAGGAHVISPPLSSNV